MRSLSKAITLSMNKPKEGGAGREGVRDKVREERHTNLHYSIHNTCSPGSPTFKGTALRLFAVTTARPSNRVLSRKWRHFLENTRIIQEVASQAVSTSWSIALYFCVNAKRTRQGTLSGMPGLQIG